MGFGDPSLAALSDGVGREVLDVLPQGVVIVDGRHLARYANQLARRLVGEGVEFGAVVPWATGGVGCETVAGKEGELRVTGAALDGLEGWELVVLSAVAHRGGPGEDRRAIVHLAEVEAIARLGSWSWDIDADSVTLSDELLRMYGLAAQPNPMSYEVFLHAAPSAVRDQIAQTFARCRQTGEGYAFTTRLVGVDGEVRGRYSRANTVTSGGRVVRMFGTIQDISERLRAEEALSVSLDDARRLASENERLRAELETQLDEARASRARIVEAGDVARRELERDLHDTVQQRLAGVGLLLRSAEAQLGASVGSELGQTVGKALQELEAGLGELRTLARGLHPAILTDQGLMAALGALARRSAVPVKLRVAPARRGGDGGVFRGCGGADERRQARCGISGQGGDRAQRCDSRDRGR